MKSGIRLIAFILNFYSLGIYADTYIHMDGQNVFEFNLRPGEYIVVRFLLKHTGVQHSCLMSGAMFEDFDDGGLMMPHGLTKDNKVLSFYPPKDMNLNQHVKIKIVNQREKVLGVLLNCQARGPKTQSATEKGDSQRKSRTFVMHDLRNGLHAQDLVMKDLIRDIMNDIENASVSQLQEWSNNLKTLSKHTQIKPFWQPAIKWVLENIQLTLQRVESDAGNQDLDFNLTLCQKKRQARKKRGNLLVQKRQDPAKKKKKRYSLRKPKTEKLTLIERILALDSALQKPDISLLQLEKFKKRAIKLGELVQRYKYNNEDVSHLTDQLGDVNLKINLISNMLVRKSGNSNALLNITLSWADILENAINDAPTNAHQMQQTLNKLRGSISDNQENIKKWIKRLQDEFNVYLEGTS